MASEVISQVVEHIEKRLTKRLQQTIQQTIDNSLSERFEELVLTSPNLRTVVQERIEGSQQSLETKIDQMREEIRQNQEDVKKIVSSMSSDADTIFSIFQMLERIPGLIKDPSEKKIFETPQVSPSTLFTPPIPPTPGPSTSARLIAPISLPPQLPPLPSTTPTSAPPLPLSEDVGKSSVGEQYVVPPELLEKVGTIVDNFFLKISPAAITQIVSPNVEPKVISPPEQTQASPAEDITQGEVGEQTMDVEVETESSGVEGLYQGEGEQVEEDEDAKGETDIESSSSEKE